MPKILCLTSHDLDGPDYGAALRCRQLFRLLEKFGEVSVVLTGQKIFWREPLPPLCGGFKLAGAVPFLPTPRRTPVEHLRAEMDPRFLNSHQCQASVGDGAWLKAMMAQHDLVWLHGLPNANGCGLWHWPRTVLDIDDIPSAYYASLLAQAGGVGEKLRWRRQIWLWRRREKKLAERFAAICVCSEPDRRWLGGAENIFTVPNGFTAPEQIPVRQPAIPPRLGFVGKYDYAPNREGVRWFVEKVWPLILQKMPATKLRLAGAGTETENWSAHRNVEALGWVADGAAEMATWALSIVPVLTGGGTRIKIAEAFSRQCPLVSTSLGAHGYDVADGCELLLADTPEMFAAKCLQILAQPETGQKLAEAGWRKFNEQWTWERQADKIARVVETVLQKKP